MENSKIKSLAANEHGFIFDPATGYSYNANKTAMIIINLLREGKKSDEILEYLYNNYEIEKDTLSNDVDFFMSQLYQYGLNE